MLPRDKAAEGERVLILAPYGRDGSLIQAELSHAGFTALSCRSVDEMCELIGEGVGAVLIADEALTPPAVQKIAELLTSQPAWSDLPLLVMTSGGASNRASRERLRLLDPLPNTSLMERPLRPVTLVSSVTAAIRARRRQYQIAEHLARIEASEQALRRSEAHFRLLSALGEATLAPADDACVTSVVVRRLGEYLKVSCCIYAVVKAGAEQPAIASEYVSEGGSQLSEECRIAPFGTAAISDLKEGRSLVIDDVETAQPEMRESLAPLGARALICCPLLKHGKLVAVLAVMSASPRAWAEDEMELVQDVLGRCWGYAERERLVAELARNNQMLQVTNQTLTSVNRELEEFAYVASHDLQEPLRMVRIYTQLILKELGEVGGTVKQYADFVDHGAHRMEDLLRDLLSFSRAAHLDTPEAESADLRAVLADALSVLRNLIDETGAEVAVESLPLVHGDPSQLAHVFQNLISNSIKYRHDSRRPVIEISAERLDAHWVIAVRDNGIGFDQRYADRIFGLFKRLHKEEYPGTGLGLAICQRIVQRYGGRMWAMGRPGEGATFYFALKEAVSPQVQ